MMEDEGERPSAVTVELNPANSPTGEVLHTEWSEAPSWFGYIGVGIALVAMLLGIVAMVFAAMYLVKWVGR